MKWFGGSIPDAIQDAKNKQSVFIVYIEGRDEMTEKMKAVWEDPGLCELCQKENCVGLKLQANSDVCAQFCQIYPVVCVPCTFFIGTNGVPLEVTGGYLDAPQFILKIQKAVQMHKAVLSGQLSAGSTGATNTSTTVAPLASTPTEAQPTASPSSSSTKPSQAEPTKRPSATSVDTQQSVPVPGPSGTQSEPQDSPLGDGIGAASAPETEDKSDIEERVRKAKDLVEMKRQEKLLKEREDHKQQEKDRRQRGQQLGKLSQWKADQEVDEIKKARKKERDEDHQAREHVRQQIAQDRAERAARFQKQKEDRHMEKENRLQARAEAEQQARAQRQAINIGSLERKRVRSDSSDEGAKKVRWETVRIQFRLPDGSTVTNIFQSSLTLETIRDFIRQRVGTLGAFSMSTAYPKHVFTEDEFSQTLLELNLAPAAAIIILPGSHSGSVIKGRRGTGGILWSLFTPLVALWGFIYNLLFGTPTQPRGTYNPAAAASRPDTQTTPAAGAAPSQPGSETKSGQAAASQRPKSSRGIRRREGNIHRLNADDDDDMATWNGNSTQQM